MLKKIMITSLLLLLLPFSTQIKAADEWNEAVTIYGAALESDNELKERTSELLNVEDNDLEDYVYSDDVNQYIGADYDDSVLKSSIRIIQESSGSGLEITIDESLGDITQISEETYQNALLTSGITDADVTIASAEDVTGESALAGIYKAYAVQGEDIPEERTQNAQDELETITEISQENENVEGFSQVQLNKMITEVKIEIINQFNGEVTEEEVRQLIDEKIDENGLDGTLTSEQIDRIVVIILNIKDSGLFTGEEADRLIDSSKDLIDQITSSEAFEDARDKAEEIGKDIQESGAWQSFLEALRRFFDAIVDFFKNLF
jgi:uncharacterized protein YpuA (DUF1002 family)